MKKPMLWGALLNLLGIPMYFEWLLSTACYYEDGFGASLSGVIGYFFGIAIYAAVAVYVVWLCIISRQNNSLPRIFLGVMLVLYSIHVLYLAFSWNHFGTLFGMIFDGFLYAKSLGFRVYIDYALACAEEILFDTNILFFWLVMLSVISVGRSKISAENTSENSVLKSSAKQPAFRDVCKFCAGGLISCAVLFSFCLAIGQTKIAPLLDCLFPFSDTAVYILGSLFGIALAACGIWHIRGSRRKHTPDEICGHSEE